MSYLRKATATDIDEIRSAYNNSVSIHLPWTYPPEDYDAYLDQQHRYFVCLEGSHRIVGTFNISGLVRGAFQSAYLGYEVFSPYQGKGYMKTGLNLLLPEAFGKLNIHRLEANIQPGNTASINLVRKAGFNKEGFSRNYLNIGGLGWKDHERWAIINNEWHNSSS